MRISDCAESADGEPIVLAVPGENVFLTHASVVARSRQRLLQAVPFALEDRLLDNVSELHFALGEALDDQVPVAVTRQSDARAWVTPFQSAGLRLDAVVPDVLLLPWEPGSVTVAQDGDRVLVRTGEHDGFVCDVQNLGFLLERLDVPDGCPVRVWGGETEGLPLRFRITREGDETALELIGRCESLPGVDLLQGDLEAGGVTGSATRVWRMTAAAAGLWLVLSFAYAITDYSMLSSQSDALSRDIESVFRETFPEGQRMVNPRVQMERALASLSGAGSGTGLMALLEWVTPVVARTPGLVPAALDYRDGQLDLDLRAGELPTLEAFRQGLETDGRFQVELQSATQSPEGVRGIIRVSEKK